MKVSPRKRFLAWVIAFLMVVTYMPSIAYATEDVTADANVEAVAEEPATDEAAEEVVADETAVAPNSAGQAKVELLDKKVSVSNTLSTATLANGIVTIVAAAPVTALDTPETNHVTIYNETADEAILKFDYEASNHKGFSESSDSGTYKKVLAAGGSVSMYITPGTVGSGDAVLTLSNFSLEAIADSYDITVKYDNKLGNVTVGGTAVASGATKTVDYASGLELAAEPASGAKFLGWINADTYELYAKEATYKLNPTESETVEAVFINAESDAYFLVAGKFLVEGFDAAATKAANTSKKTMVLMNDATLPAGKYIVPTGVTMLIPFDDKNTIYRKTPEAVHDSGNKPATPVAYRTLKMADGAEIIVNGELSLSAKHYAAGGGGRGAGAPTGDVSFLDMAKGSSVVLNDGAYLYAYGYIVGEGTVTAKDGATVYENFQIEGFRGGTVTSDMAVDDTLAVEGQEKGINHGVLPISQYYVQNIEVPITLEAGATEYTYTSIYMSETIFGAAVAFISDRGAMFNLADGKVVKSYDGSTDRLVVEANGNMALSSITVSLKDNEINSKNFELPINSNISVKINSGEVEINQDLALLPGSEISIAKGAKCSLINGANVYVYDAEQWGNYAYSGSGNTQMVPVFYAYSKSYDRTKQNLEDASVLVNGMLDASDGFIYTTTNDKYHTGYGNIYSTGAGVVKMLSGEAYVTYQYVQNDSVPYKEVCILPANLKQDNKDNDAYFQPYDDPGIVGTYTYTDGVWLCDHEATGEIIKEADCTNAGSKTVRCVMEHEYNLTIPAKGHKAVTDPAVKGSCTVDAKTEGSHCGVCDEVLVAQVVTKAPGHTEEVIKGKAATCEETGLTDGKKCTTCGETTVEQEVIPSLGGHKWVYDENAKPATCTEDGYGSSTCENCGEEIKGDTIPKLGHDYKWTVTTQPTCIKEGVKEGVCQRDGCGDKTTGTVEATGHSFKNYVDNEDATCTEAGTATAKCENGCGETKDKATEALGHLWKKDGKGELLYEVVKAPTCTAKGSEAVHCERCDATDKAREIDATGHTEEKLKAKPANCTEPGLTAGSKCSVCGEILVAQEEVPSLGGHKWNEGVIVKLPSMTTNKSTGEVEYLTGKRVFECTNTGCTEKKEEVLDWGKIKTYDEFIKNLAILEDWAFEYAIKNNIEDPAALVIRYIRTGVDRYNSGSWQIMAGVDNLAFTDYVTEKELSVNDKAKTDADKVNVTGLKNISNFTLANGEYVDFGHMFGTMDISYTNKTSINHADVAGFFGDTVDLLSTADRYNVRGTVREMTAEITDKYFLKDHVDWDDKFGYTDMLGDLDGYYLNRELISEDYEKGRITELVTGYFTKDLSEKQRAQYYLTNRLQCGTSKAAVRDAVYTAYTGNSVISTLEGTRTFNASGDTLSDLRKATCYTVADYICKLAGDYTADIDNPCYTVNSEKFDVLAPGITQEIKTAVMNLEVGGQQMKYDMQYYVATVDITRDDVSIYANYPTRPIEKVKDENGKDQYVWSRKTVLEQANDAQKTYGDPDSELYIPNFNVIASTNADGFDMTGDERGEPGGLLIMDGEEIAPITSNGFFGILEDGTAVIGTANEYNNIYRGKVKEAVGGFGSMLVDNGKIVATSRGGLAPRTAVGITGTGKVVMMVLDGRQPGGVSAGGDMLDIAHIMLEAGCVEAINLDGGGSSTYVAKQPGDEELSLVSKPSDGYPRALGSSLMAVSTAKSSTIFDHAVLKAPTNYMTVGSEMQLTAEGVTSTGNAVDIPAGAKWTVNEEDAKDATITADGKLTALRTGEVNVNLVVDGVTAGQKRIYVVVPDSITFTKAKVEAVYNAKVALPIKAYYQGKAVTVNAGDFEFEISNEAGTMDGLSFAAGPETTGLKRTVVTANVAASPSVTASIEVYLYKQGENTFDFDQKTGGSREFAWLRTVTNSETNDNTTYYSINKNQPMATEYTFAIDMTQIPIPEVLEELTDMLPGNDVEGACAWTYLCNLAQRISDMTEVTATVKLDDDLKLVDVNNIKVKNDYFKMPEDGSGVVYDEKNNTVTLKLNWIRQYSPIDIEMADPLCLVNGIKVVPKDGANWGANETLNIINSGDISYEVYMRASSLYTFANDKDNQAKYGLFPFSNTYVDKDGITQSESGGGFKDTYHEFTDSYNLVNAEKNGWYVEDGGWKYYNEGEALKGIQKIDEMVDGQLQSLYYDFGEEGIIKGNAKVTYTGLIENDELFGKKSYSYATFGKLTGGWVKIGEDWHYFNPTTMKTLDAGKHKIVVKSQSQSSAIDAKPITIEATVEYELDAKGKVVGDGTWLTDQSGNKYYMNGTWFVNEKMDNKTYFYYGPGFVCRQWGEKDGKKVYFAMEGHLLNSNIVRIREDSNRPAMYHMFDENGYWIQLCEGFVEYNGYTFYYPTEEERMNGDYPDDVQNWESDSELRYGRAIGLQKVDGKYYLFSEPYGRMLTGKREVNAGEGTCTTVTFDKTHGYAVDINGKVRTDLTHKLGAKKFFAPTAKATGGYGQQCEGCGEIKWTQTQSYNTYVKNNLPKTTIKVTATAYRKSETVTVKWKPSKTIATYYKVERATKKNGKYKTIKAKATTTSYIDKTAKPGQTYYYRVTGYAKASKLYKSKVSNKDSAKIIKATKSYVQKTTMKGSTAYIAKGVQVKWTAPRIKVSKYQVYRATTKNGKYKLVATVGYGKLSYNDKKVTVGKKYYYKVRGYKFVNGKKVYTKFSPKYARTVAK